MKLELEVVLGYISLTIKFELTLIAIMRSSCDCQIYPNNISAFDHNIMKLELGNNLRYNNQQINLSEQFNLSIEQKMILINFNHCEMDSYEMESCEWEIIA
jgi:hypothetical protein